jgi:hypothetical protein
MTRDNRTHDHAYQGNSSWAENALSVKPKGTQCEQEKRRLGAGMATGKALDTKSRSLDCLVDSSKIRPFESDGSVPACV